MELRFVSPDLARLDEIDSEVLVCSAWEDVRPTHGVAGLCDFRLAGRISSLQRRGLVTGRLGERVMIPGKPKLRFEKVILVGAGPKSAFDEATFESLVGSVLQIMEDLLSRACVIELPGRQNDLIPPERAADILLASAGRRPEHDVWTLVEHAAARERVTQHMIEEKRRVRRLF